MWREEKPKLFVRKAYLIMVFRLIYNFVLSFSKTIERYSNTAAYLLGCL